MNLQKLFIAITIILITQSAIAQAGGWNPKLKEDASETLKLMIDDRSKLQAFYDEAYGYAVFPKITKAGIGIGGAGGKGLVYKAHDIVGTSKMKQASIGLQLGGQQYREIVFFENKEAFDHFCNGNLKFGAQASAVAITEGASIDAAYVDGVAVFTQAIGGLMYEASIGGQHFTFKANKG
jgi:lipid-binding SYLF domain-containing protein